MSAHTDVGNFFKSIDPSNLFKPSNQYVEGYPGAQNLQQLLMQMFTGGGVQQLGGLAGVGGAQQPNGGTGISQFMNMQSPTMQALNTAMPALQAQLSGGGADVLNPLRTSYQQNLGDLLGQSNTNARNRFSSGLDTQNTLLKQRSLADFNTLGGQLLEQGKSRQLQAAQTLGGLSNNAQSQQLLALMSLFGPMLGNTYGGTNVQSPGFGTQWMQMLAATAGAAKSAGG